MKEYPTAKFQVEWPGPIKVNGGLIVAQTPNIVCMDFDLEAKYAEIAGYCYGKSGSPGVLLEATSETLNHRVEAAHELTHIAFPDYGPHWEIYSAHVSRYTLRVCLVNI